MNMRLLTPPPHDDKFYVNRPYSGDGFPTLADARSHAGMLQANGTYSHSIRIYRNGEIVDYKRY